MARFLHRAEVQEERDRIIDSAESILYIISPYIQINSWTKELIEGTESDDIDVNVIARQQKGKRRHVRKTDEEFLMSLNWVTTSYCPALHSKCYLNENEALVTSMNLTQGSEYINSEMGILVVAEDEEELYDDILNECRYIESKSECVSGPKRRPVRNVVYIEGQGVEAKGHLIKGNRFEVHTGSTALLDPSPSLSIENLAARDHCINEDWLRKDGQVYRFAIPIMFPDPSTAASVILGINANGYRRWKSKRGKPLSEVRRR